MKYTIDILIISCVDLFPQHDGGVIRIFALAKAMSRFAQITVIYPTIRSDNENDVFTYGLDNLKLYPVLIQNSKLLRINQVIRGLIDICPPFSTSVRFSELGVAIRKLLSEQLFSIIQFEHSASSYYFPLVNNLSKAKKILVLHNIETDRISQLELPLSRRSSIGRLFQWLDKTKVRDWEGLIVKKFDGLIVMSPNDKQRLIELFPDTKDRIQIVPNGVSFFPDSWKKGGKTVVIVASLNYTPNYEAARWVVNEIMPLVWEKEPLAQLIIAGSSDQGTDISIFQQKDSRIKVMVNVPSVLDIYAQATVALVAVRTGGGTALKLLEAFSTGCPVVSTKVGCRGYNTSLPCLIAETAEEMSSAILHVLGNFDIQQILSSKGRDFVMGQYIWDAIAKSALSYYSTTFLNGKNIF